ncbi:stemmadenine O-acetyltransferase-like [Argentina anserina]|uniref:stemmadenine O-acetyltransferase-like n=1 Tax=Argentina anserina TaxID=57926 RepID=UPI0021765656|nr:stemmadenine O-acetyltransferase-like [Potentilla anserina]
MYWSIPSSLNKLVPYQLDEVADIALGVQLNVFECDGIAVGASISHKIADALSFSMFIKTWAGTSRRDHHHQIDDHPVVSPQFVSATLFPPRNISGFNPSVGITKENIVTKSLGGSQRSPSRVDALSAFIWSRYVAATKVGYEAPAKVDAIIHAVNLRNRIDPPLPECSFGNLYRISVTVPRLDTGEECYGLVRQVREQISHIDTEYIKKLQEGNDHLSFIQQSSENVNKGEMVTLSFTSLCRFPLYEADFGWGKPTWVGSPALNFNNLVVFMDTKSGGGIEAY